jgi:hypothetical protein
MAGNDHFFAFLGAVDKPGQRIFRVGPAVFGRWGALVFVA